MKTKLFLIIIFSHGLTLWSCSDGGISNGNRDGGNAADLPVSTDQKSLQEEGLSEEIQSEDVQLLVLARHGKVHQLSEEEKIKYDNGELKPHYLDSSQRICQEMPYDLGLGILWN